jgi:thiamine-phosphate pyrophosphorylase
MKLYYITDRSGFPGDEAARRRQVVEKIAEAARAGVDYIQLREKDLSAGELEALGREAVRVVRQASSTTKILINSRTDLALTVEADGVHLRGDDISPREVAAIGGAIEKNEMRVAKPFLTVVSCHSVDDVRRSELEGASFAVLAPIFGKQTDMSAQTVGLASLEAACSGGLPVLALGSVDFENSRACLRAGAAGIAAIRLFQNNVVEDVVGVLRSV